MKKIKKLLVLVFVMSSGFSANESYGQTYAPAAVFYYDLTGKRVKRQIEEVCIGPDCPPITIIPTTESKPNPHPEDSLLYQQAEIQAFPNPAEEELNVNNPRWKETDKALVVVFDISSKVVLKKDINKARGEIKFRDMVPGIYMVQYYLNGTPVGLWKVIRP